MGRLNSRKFLGRERPEQAKTLDQIVGNPFWSIRFYFKQLQAVVSTLFCFPR